jgi:glutamate synthase domain-containing protein 3
MTNTGTTISGGKIDVYPSPEVVAGGFLPQDQIVVGKVCFYGATLGKAFFSDQAGERFCVRNLGALTVVEGDGDHGCEYMTGGIVVCLGATGRNFGAGMSRGVPYVYDPDGRFSACCNMGLAGLETINASEKPEEIYGYIKKHTDYWQPHWPENVSRLAKPCRNVCQIYALRLHGRRCCGWCFCIWRCSSRQSGS